MFFTFQGGLVCQYLCVYIWPVLKPACTICLGERFARRILCPAEYDYCFSHTDPSTHVAARFAAKEAVSKAFGTGIGTELGWLDIEVIRLESGSTQVRLQG